MYTPTRIPYSFSCGGTFAGSAGNTDERISGCQNFIFGKAAGAKGGARGVAQKERGHHAGVVGGEFM